MISKRAAKRWRVDTKSALERLASNLVWNGFWRYVFLLLSPAGPATAQNQPILLWPNGAPGSESKTAEERVRVIENGEHIVSGVHRPSITPYLPSKERGSGTAVIVIPGGGHRELWMDHEGYNVAKWLSEHGGAAFILKYRLARDSASTYTVEGTEMADVKRAIRLVRSRAREWALDEGHIGVMGFSAGANWPPWRALNLTRVPRALRTRLSVKARSPPFKRCCIHPFRTI